MNGDDVEAVARVGRLAAEWRQRFKRDVVIDIVCYRKHGHNEIDNPMFTQPMMYTTVKKQVPTIAKFRRKLITEGVVSSESAEELSKGIMSELSSKLEASRTYQSKKSDWLASNWKGMLSPGKIAQDMTTGVEEATLRRVGAAMSTLPPELTPHKKVKDIYNQETFAPTHPKPALNPPPHPPHSPIPLTRAPHPPPYPTP